MNNILKGLLSFFAWIPKFYKEHKDVFYIVVIALLLLFTFLFIRNKNQKVAPVVDKTAKYDSLLNVLIDRNNLLYTEVKTIRVENTMYVNLVDSLAKALKLKPKFINGEDRYIFKTDTFFREVPNVVYLGKDTVYNVRKLDNHIDVNAYAGKDFGLITVKSQDTLIRIETSKTNIWGKTTDNVLLRNTNPYNKIYAGYSYSKVQKRTYLTLGPAIIYDPFRNQFSLGVSLQYPLIQLKK